MANKAFITGCAGESLSSEERDFFRQTRPCGLILFARNCQDPVQLRALIEDFRDCVEDPQAPVFIDQEGGRVQRLTRPLWRRFPPVASLGVLSGKSPESARDAAFAFGRLLAEDLQKIGITADCAPVLDLKLPEGHAIIGDRAFSSDPETVTLLGRALAEGLMAGGVLPVMKHIPGHGRADADSHLALPRITTPLSVLKKTDFVPFRKLAYLPMAMTAHILLPELDPENPVSLSSAIITQVIRGHMGFDGLLMTDDISMGALTGSLGERAEAAIAAGCDVVLHCNGQLAEMQAVAAAVPCLDGKARARYEEIRKAPRPRTKAPDEATADRLLSQLAALVEAQNGEGDKRNA